MAPLDDHLRRAFETAVISAHEAASEQRWLFTALRARQPGNGDLAAGTRLLVKELAYEQWHRMLFARFLAENDLVMHPAGAAVTLQDCADLALESEESDAWQVATSFAARMLPGIFRADTPAV